MIKERLPSTRDGKILHFVIRSESSEVDGYLRTGVYEDGRLGEVFLQVGKAGSSDALYDQWAIAFSIALQYGADVSATCQKFVGTRFEPSGFTNVEGVRQCTSVLDLVCRWLKSKYGSEVRAVRESE